MMILRKIGWFPVYLLCLIVCSQTAVPAQSVTFKTLHVFTGTDGASPLAPVIEASDGNFYSTTESGGAGNSGTIFKLTPDGTLTTLYAFSPLNWGYIPATNGDGGGPVAGLVQAGDGNFYGSAEGGGVHGLGTLFKITPEGTFTVLRQLGAASGDVADPTASLVVGPDGNFYGTSRFGGSNGEGTVFKATATGLLGILYSFRLQDGAVPVASLTLGPDGNFYGTTILYGSSGLYFAGSIYKVTPSGTEATIFNFDGLTTDQPLPNATGSAPSTGLTLGKDGNFYGTTMFGGPYAFGTVFRITPAGEYTVLHSFGQQMAQGLIPDGVEPMGALALGPDGAFYGTTFGGGTQKEGTVFRIWPDGRFTTLYSFQGSEGAEPQAALVLGSDGYFYGTAAYGGAFNDGTVFRIRPYIPADFDSDGRSAVLVQNATSGQLAAWLWNGTNITTSAITPTPPQYWTCVGTGDFNGDGQPDVVLQNILSGQLAVWFMSDEAAIGGAFIYPIQEPHWRCVGVADFNGDNQPDFLFQQITTGQLAMWFMQGTTTVTGAYVYPEPGPDQRCVGTGDFDGDNQPDLLFQNKTTGALTLWLMDPVHPNYAMSVITLTVTPPLDWQAVAVMDVNADGYPDIVFQSQTTGKLAYWQLSGTTIVSSSWLFTTPPVGWKVAGPH